MLHITKRDAQTGQKDPANCAAAKAACRLEGVLEARVFKSRTYLKVRTATGRIEWLRFETPISLQKEIIAFDRGGFFAHGDFNLPPMPKSAHLGKRKPTGPHRRRGPKRKVHIVQGVRADHKNFGRERYA